MVEGNKKKISFENNEDNTKGSFKEYKESSYRTQWGLAFEQSQYLKQNGNDKPSTQLKENPLTEKNNKNKGVNVLQHVVKNIQRNN